MLRLACERAAAERTTSIPERDYLATQAARLSAGAVTGAGTDTDWRSLGPESTWTRPPEARPSMGFRRTAHDHHGPCDGETGADKIAEGWSLLFGDP